MHWVPSYVRNEIKKKTGNVVDQYGNLVKKGENADEEENINSKLFNDKSGGETLQKEQKQYTPIEQYKPSGNLVYKPEHFQKIEKKVTFS
jgi:hypothetical protein